MEELLMELKILKNIMSDSAQSLKFRLDNDDEFAKDTSFLEEDITFGTILHALTKDISKSDLLLMSDADMLKHIHKIQVIEKD
jgi:hypothetical protein